MAYSPSGIIKETFPSHTDENIPGSRRIDPTKMPGSRMNRPNAHQMKVEFARDGISTTAEVDYPSNPPSEEEENTGQNAEALAGAAETEGG